MRRRTADSRRTRLGVRRRLGVVALSTAALVPALVPLAGVAEAATVGLDPGYGSNGIVTLSAPVGDFNGFFAFDTVVSTQGTSYVAGDYVADVSESIRVYARDAKGRPFAAFSGDGVFVRPAPSTGFEFVAGSAAAPGGGLFVLIDRFDSSFNDLPDRVLKLTSAGVPDTRFSGDGLADVPAGSAEFVYAVVADSAGRLYLAGDSSNVNGDDGVISRLTAAGAPDTTFGGGTGAISTPIAASSKSVEALDVSPEGQLYFVQQEFPEVAKVARLTDSGALDVTFGGGDGYVDVAARATSLLVSRVGDTAGTVLVAVQAASGSPRDERVLRLTTTGVPDTSFSGDGYAGFPADDLCCGIYDLAEDALGRVLGLRESSRAVAAKPFRLSPTGVLDTGFTVTDGVDAERYVPIQDVDVLPDGGILLSGDDPRFDPAYRIAKVLDDVAAAGSRFSAVAPKRILDTRSGLGRPGVTKVGTTTFDLQVRGVGGVPADATAVVLNVTAVAPTGGFVTVWPAGESQPGASNINTSNAVNIPNLVVAKIGAGGKVSLRNSSGTTHLLGDVAGYYSTTAGQKFTPVAPVRLLDTRSTTAVGPKATRSVTVTGALPQGLVVPADASAVVVNVTGVSPSADTFVTVFPKGTAQPATSSLNLKKLVNAANLVTVKVANGGITLFNDAGSTGLLVDIAGYYSPGSTGSFVALSPFRQLDTRSRVGVSTTTPIANNGTVPLDVSVGGVPLGATAVVLNVVAVAPAGNGFLTVYPAGTTKPTVSNLNYGKGVTRANLVVVKVGSGGVVNLAVGGGGATHLLADVAGYFVE